MTAGTSPVELRRFQDVYITDDAVIHTPDGSGPLVDTLVIPLCVVPNGTVYREALSIRGSDFQHLAKGDGQGGIDFAIWAQSWAFDLLLHRRDSESEGLGGPAAQASIGWLKFLSDGDNAMKIAMQRSGESNSRAELMALREAQRHQRAIRERAMDILQKENLVELEQATRAGDAEAVQRLNGQAEALEAVDKSLTIREIFGALL